MSDVRGDRAAALLGTQELDTLLVTDLTDVRWLTGFTGSNGACVITADERLFLTDFRYTEQAAEQVTGFEAVTVGRDLLGDVASRLAGRTAFDDTKVTVRTHTQLGEKSADGVELVASGALIPGLREVKDAGELAAIGAATDLATAALQRVLERGLVGRTERVVAAELEDHMRDAGATGPSFASIVAAGPHGALPHAVPRDQEIPADTLVVVDFGAVLDGYCSDCTRTYATGSLDDEARDVYELVRRAQQTGLDAVRAGVEAKAVDAQARAVIDEAGHGEEFGHSLGHGVGMEVHEGPVLAARSESTLETGNVVSVEPGVYLPGRFGVRIEDLVAVTDDGTEVFTAALPKELTVVA